LLYAADMNLAQQSLKQNNLGRARRLLDLHRPQPGQEDLRGWEWRYLWQLTRSSALVTLTNRPVRGFDVSFSPDGTRLAVGWYDGHVDLWDVPHRRLLRALTDRGDLYPAHVAFSPVRNLLAATSESNVVTLYDLDSGSESVLWQTLDQAEWPVHDLSFSEDGSKVVIFAGQIHGSASNLCEVSVVNASTSQIENRHSTLFNGSIFMGAARLSPDNRRLYLARSDQSAERYSIQCLDLSTGQKIWQTETLRGAGLSTLAISPDGNALVSGSGYEDPTIRVWDAATGRLLRQLEGHSSWVCKLSFSKDGRQMISAAADQTIRLWETSAWTETKVLRGHSDEVHAAALSEKANLIASAGKDGNLMLWNADTGNAADGYSRLPENFRNYQVWTLDRARVLLSRPDDPPGLLDLKSGAPPLSLTELGPSSNILGFFGGNILCQWNGTNQILVREWRGGEFVQLGAVTLDSGQRPAGFAYNPARQLLAWTEKSSSNTFFLTGLQAPARRIELKSDVAGAPAFAIGQDGKYLLAIYRRLRAMRIWNIDTGQITVSGQEDFMGAGFALGGSELIATLQKDGDIKLAFYDLTHPGQTPLLVPGQHAQTDGAVSPDGRLMAVSSEGGLVQLFDAAKGKLIETLHGHLNAVFGVAFSADGRRLISSGGGREAIKLWDVGTWQELMTLSGAGSLLSTAIWSADGDVILAGAPYQTWRAPSWDEINAAEAKEKAETKQP
jgi:WD40 repeat protein